MMFSVLRNGNGPFRLKMISQNDFEIHSKSGRAFKGQKEAIVAKAIELGVHAPEIEIAFSEMEKMGHDCAEFGIGGMFIYTFRGRLTA